MKHENLSGVGACALWRNFVFVSQNSNGHDTAMILSGDTIQALKIFEPFNERTKHNGMSYGKSFAGYDIRIAETLTIKPQGFALASSMEYFSIPTNVIAMVCDKSTWARRGLSMLNTIAEPGWRGYLTLELFNASDKWIGIDAGDPIAQIVCMYVDKHTSGYDGKYQDQRAGAVPAIFE